MNNTSFRTKDIRYLSDNTVLFDQGSYCVVIPRDHIIAAKDFDGVIAVQLDNHSLDEYKKIGYPEVMKYYKLEIKEDEEKQVQEAINNKNGIICKLCRNKIILITMLEELPIIKNDIRFIDTDIDDLIIIKIKDWKKFLDVFK